MAVQAFKRLSVRARTTAVLNDFRIIAGATNAYSLEKGAWPPTTAAGVLPAALQGYVTQTNFTNPSPIGGYYTWATNSVQGGSTYQAVIIISSANGNNITTDQGQLLDIDKRGDNQQSHHGKHFFGRKQLSCVRGRQIAGLAATPMFKVSTLYLDPEVRHPGVQHGSASRGELDAAGVIAMLETFRSIDALEMIDLDPQIIAAGRACKLIIRTNRKKLFAYNAQNMNEAALEMTPAEIVQRLDDLKPALVADEADQSGLVARTPPSRTKMGYALLAIALLINIYTVYTMVSKPAQVDDKSDVVYVADASERAQKQRIVAGTYATGNTRGNRILMIDSDGTLQYSEIGAPGNPAPWTGTYRVGSRNQNLCLSVDGASVIDVIDPNTLVYYRDTFHRIK